MLPEAERWQCCALGSSVYLPGISPLEPLKLFRNPKSTWHVERSRVEAPDVLALLPRPLTRHQTAQTLWLPSVQTSQGDPE